MRVIDLIQRKRDGEELLREEADFFLQGAVRGQIPDYQIAAMLMAVFFSGLSEQETVDWTESMLKMAPPLDLSGIAAPKIGKHSTGGVGDKTSLVVGPLVAAAGVAVPMIVGRGLAHTGGTLDKLEAIPGFNAHLKAQEFTTLLRNVGVAINGPTEELTPADSKLYPLRNATATVESIPLTASSILSVKFAEGTDGVVFDVKTGAGALFSKITDARRLAQLIVTVAKRLGKRSVCVLTDMDQPLGNAIGNALEVMEAIETMRGNGPADLVELSLEIGSRMLSMAHPDRSVESAKEQLFKLLNDGSALQKFRQLIEFQGANPQVVDKFDLLPTASAEFVVSSPRAGYISRISADDIGRAAILLGAGRETVDSTLDRAVGIVLEHKIGDRIQAGEGLCTIYYNAETHVEEASQMVEDAFRISANAPEAPTLIYEVIQ
jgi:pyrimidine-nucleoside phosphorylase